MGFTVSLSPLTNAKTCGSTVMGYRLRKSMFPAAIAVNSLFISFMLRSAAFGWLTTFKTSSDFDTLGGRKQPISVGGFSRGENGVRSNFLTALETLYCVGRLS